VARGKLRPRVLVVDDEASIRALICDAVKDLGYKAAEAADGVAAVALLDQHRFDLIVTDLRMPRMGGWEVVNVVQRRDTAMPIILMAGFATYADKQRAVQGELVLLLKPFQFDGLKQAIREAMKQASA
jgi:CheY-like chemotaxis protein